MGPDPFFRASKDVLLLIVRAIGEAMDDLLGEKKGTRQP
jgi:hypothetical protein